MSLISHADNIRQLAETYSKAYEEECAATKDLDIANAEVTRARLREEKALVTRKEADKRLKEALG